MGTFYFSLTEFSKKTSFFRQSEEMYVNTQLIESCQAAHCRRSVRILPVVTGGFPHSSMEIPEYYLDLATTASFEILSNSSFASHSTIPREISTLSP
jgi:hypothetical protein